MVRRRNPWVPCSVADSLLNYFERLEYSKSPYLEQRYGLDREQFDPVLDEFYALHGWDPQRGWWIYAQIANMTFVTD
jgi:hypothetical protein